MPSKCKLNQGSSASHVSLRAKMLQVSSHLRQSESRHTQTVNTDQLLYAKSPPTFNSLQFVRNLSVETFSSCYDDVHCSTFSALPLLSYHTKCLSVHLIIVCWRLRVKTLKFLVHSSRFALAGSQQTPGAPLLMYSHILVDDMVRSSSSTQVISCRVSRSDCPAGKIFIIQFQQQRFPTSGPPIRVKQIPRVKSWFQEQNSCWIL